MQEKLHARALEHCCTCSMCLSMYAYASTGNRGKHNSKQPKQANRNPLWKSPVLYDLKGLCYSCQCFESRCGAACSFS